MNTIVDIKFRNSIGSPVKINADWPKSVLGFVDWTLERFIFFKLGLFSNYPRINLVWIQAVYTTIILSFIFFFIFKWLFLELQIAPVVPPYSVTTLGVFRSFLLAAGLSGVLKGVLTLIGAASVIFWKRSDIIRNQWTYCSDLFNDLQKEPNPVRRELFYGNLVMDLFLSNLWAHRSYKDVFAQHLSRPRYPTAVSSHIMNDT
jgi:hypothetical protein